MSVIRVVHDRWDWEAADIVSDAAGMERKDNFEELRGQPFVPSI